MTTRADTFSLYRTVRQVIADGGGPDPKDIATKVVQLIPVGMEWAVIEALLPEFCRHVLIEPRRGNRAIRRTEGTIEGKWLAIRESILDDPYEVEGTWRLFGDLTLADVLWVVEDRKQSSLELATQAERLASLAGAMKRRKVSTVRELPLEVIEKVMS